MQGSNLLLYNANVVTLDSSGTRASTVVVAGGCTAWVGTGDPPAQAILPGTDRVDCRGATVLPGFIDPHCHPLALGAALRAVDCGPRAVRSIRDIQDRLRAAASRTPADAWVKAAGYDELLLADRRHPTRADLDAAVPTVPVRLTHGSGHAMVLNTKAMRLLGIGAGTPEPPGGVIDRDADTGEPTGLLFEMGAFVSERMRPLDSSEARANARAASEALLSAGVTSVADAGPRNGAARLDLYRNLRASGDFVPRVAVMTDAMQDIPKTGGDVEGVRLGAAKLSLSVTSGGLDPPRGAVLAAARRAAADGRQLAVHAVEREAIYEAATVMLLVHEMLPRPDLRWRIEHASECPPGATRDIRKAGAMVVSQPGFILERGARYLLAAQEGGAAPEHLYPVRSLMEAGVIVAAGSDSPVGPYAPLAGVQAAATRLTADGRSCGAAQAVTAEAALRMHAPLAAYAQFEETTKGTIEAGKLADFAVLDADPLAVPLDRIAAIRVLRTFVAGVQVWPRQ